MVLVGDIFFEELKLIVKEIEDDLFQLSNVFLVNVWVLIDEIVIEIKFELLCMYNLIILDVINVIN